MKIAGERDNIMLMHPAVFYVKNKHGKTHSDIVFVTCEALEQLDTLRNELHLDLLWEK